MTADTWDIGMLLHQGRTGHGAYELVRGMDVPATGGLAISDVVTSVRGTETSFARPSGMVHASPYATVPTGSALHLFFEVYGVPAKGTFKTSFEFAPTSGTGRSVRVSVNDKSTGDVTDIRRTLDLNRLSPGIYRLTVRVTAQGRTVVRQRLLTLTK